MEVNNCDLSGIDIVKNLDDMGKELVSVKLLNHKDLLIVKLKVNVERDDDDGNRVK